MAGDGKQRDVPQPDPNLAAVPDITPWLFVVGGIFAAISLGMVASLVAISVTGSQRNMGVLVAGQLGLWAGLLGSIALAARRLEPISDFWSSIRSLTKLRMLPKDIVWVLLGPLVQAAIGAAYAPFTTPEKMEQYTTTLVELAHRNVGLYALLCVSTVVGAPVVEELFFRGLILRATRSLPVLVAACISGCIFGAIHLQPLLFPALAFVGGLSAVLARRYNRLGPSIWFHVGFNGVTMAVMAAKVFG